MIFICISGLSIIQKWIRDVRLHHCTAQVYAGAWRFVRRFLLFFSVCSMLTQPGRCKGFFPRYSFQQTECKPFIYGGCGGNANNFLTLEECQQHCQNV